MSQILTNGVNQNGTGTLLLSDEIISRDLPKRETADNNRAMKQALESLNAPQDNHGNGNKSKNKKLGPKAVRYLSYIESIQVKSKKAKIPSLKSAINDLLQQYVLYAPGLSNEKLKKLEATILNSVIGLVDSQRHVVSGLPKGYVAAEVSNESKSIVDPKQLDIQNAILDLAMELGSQLPEVENLVVELIRAEFIISEDNVEAIAAIKRYIADASQLLMATSTTADTNSPLKGIPR